MSGSLIPAVYRFFDAFRFRTVHPVRQFDYATVVYVVDGDTCDIEIDLGFSIKHQQRFRLVRINTPERGKPGFAEARQFLSDATLGKAVMVNSTKLDKYGRYLCELAVDGRNINDEMLLAGLAKPYV